MEPRPTTDGAIGPNFAEERFSFFVCPGFVRSQLRAVTLTALTAVLYSTQHANRRGAFRGVHTHRRRAQPLTHAQARICETVCACSSSASSTSPRMSRPTRRRVESRPVVASLASGLAVSCTRLACGSARRAPGSKFTYAPTHDHSAREPRTVARFGVRPLPALAGCSMGRRAPPHASPRHRLSRPTGPRPRQGAARRRRW